MKLPTTPVTSASSPRTSPRRRRFLHPQPQPRPPLTPQPVRARDAPGATGPNRKNVQNPPKNRDPPEKIIPLAHHRPIGGGTMRAHHPTPCPKAAISADHRAISSAVGHAQREGPLSRPESEISNLRSPRPIPQISPNFPVPTEASPASLFSVVNSPHPRTTTRNRAQQKPTFARAGEKRTQNFVPSGAPKQYPRPTQSSPLVPQQ
jgi:hypothetical protein